jgi:hypothetical protein
MIATSSGHHGQDFFLPTAFRFLCCALVANTIDDLFFLACFFFSMRVEWPFRLGAELVCLLGFWPSISISAKMSVSMERVTSGARAERLYHGLGLSCPCLPSCQLPSIAPGLDVAATQVLAILQTNVPF